MFLHQLPWHRIYAATRRCGKLENSNWDVEPSDNGSSRDCHCHERDPRYGVSLRDYRIVLVFAFTASVASFLVATAYTRHRLSKLDDMAIAIETTASPAIEYMAELRSKLQDVQGTLRTYLDQQGSVHADPAPVRAALGDLQKHVDSRSVLTAEPRAETLWRSVQREVRRTSDAVEDTLAERDAVSARLLLYDRVIPVIDRAGEAMLATMEFNIHLSQSLAREVRQVRVEAVRAAFLLEIVSVVLSLVAAVIVYRAFRRHEELLVRHNELVADRAEELDRFAGRVAHDIVGPLSTVTLGIAAMEQSLPTDVSRRPLERMKRAIERVTSLVQALLGFARAGARPEPGVHSDVHHILTELVEEYTGTADAQDIAVSLECPEHVEVACEGGVLASIVENLVRNAIKYMGDSQVRRIAIRATDRNDDVRIEVADTGPGIALDLLPHLFEPFVRGKVGGDGAGLGLATVKRLTERHGGRIGLQSDSGRGSVFWVDLPRSA